MDHQPLPVSGYTSQSELNVARVNEMKEAEERVLRKLDFLKEDHTIDQRWLAIGRTQIEQGFMAVNRAIFKPTRINI